MIIYVRLVQQRKMPVPGSAAHDMRSLFQDCNFITAPAAEIFILQVRSGSAQSVFQRRPADGWILDISPVIVFIDRYKSLNINDGLIHEAHFPAQLKNRIGMHILRAPDLDDIGMAGGDHFTDHLIVFFIDILR